MAGFDFDHLPVPYRMGQRERMINLQTVELPDTVTSIEAAKIFLAEKFDTTEDKIAQMGPSFFTSIDHSPQRIYPFAIGRAGGWSFEAHKFYAPIMDIWIFDETDFKWSFLYKWGGAVMTMSYMGGYGASYQPRGDENDRRFAIQGSSNKQAAPTSKGGNWYGKKGNDNRRVADRGHQPERRKNVI